LSTDLATPLIGLGLAGNARARRDSSCDLMTGRGWGWLVPFAILWQSIAATRCREAQIWATVVICHRQPSANKRGCTWLHLWSVILLARRDIGGGF